MDRCARHPSLPARSRATGQRQDGLGANLARDPDTFVAASHFCRANEFETRSPLKFLERVCAQLAHHSPSFDAALLAATKQRGGVSVDVEINISDARDTRVTGIHINEVHIHADRVEDLVGDILTGPLRAIEHDITSPWIVIVDALDEAERYDGNVTISRLLRGLGNLPRAVRFVLTFPPKCRSSEATCPKRFARYRSQLVQRCAGCGSDLCGSGAFRACPLRSDRSRNPGNDYHGARGEGRGEFSGREMRGCGGERRAGYLDSGDFFRDAQRPSGSLSRNPGPEPQRWGCDLARAIRAHHRAARGRRRAAHRTPDRRGDRRQAQRDPHSLWRAATIPRNASDARWPSEMGHISPLVRGVPARRAECRSLLVPSRRGACVVCGLGLSRGNAWSSTGVLSIPTCNVI